MKASLNRGAVVAIGIPAAVAVRHASVGAGASVANRSNSSLLLRHQSTTPAPSKSCSLTQKSWLQARSRLFQNGLR